MATRKQSTGTRKTPADEPVHPEGLSEALAGSARQIWLAGMGAFSRAQAEGSRMFESLVGDGLDLEKAARKFDEGAGHVRERASGAWDRLEQAFDDRVQRTLHRLDVPGRHDLAELNRRLDALTRELRRANSPAARRQTSPTPDLSPLPRRKTGAATSAPARPANKATKATKATKKVAARKGVTRRPSGG